MIYEKKELVELLSTLTQSTVQGSAISLIIPASKRPNDVQSILKQKISNAQNIKIKTNRHSVLENIKSVSEILKSYSKIPANGLMIYIGNIQNPQNKNKSISISHDFQPFQPINNFVYLCDKHFHYEEIQNLVKSTEKQYGYIILDGESAIFATNNQNSTSILKKIKGNLSNNHNKGGQSAPRFSRLRQEKIDDFLKICLETAIKCFISDDELTIEGLIVAGSGNLKNSFVKNFLCDKKMLNKILIQTLDISKNSEQGLIQAQEMAKQYLNENIIMNENQLLNEFFKEININSDLAIYGFDETIKQLQRKSIKVLFCYENLDYLRISQKNLINGSEKVKFIPRNEYLTEPKKKSRLQYVEENVQDLVEWLHVSKDEFECQKVVFINDKSAFKGFEGFCGLLKYKQEITYDYEKDEKEDFKNIEKEYDKTSVSGVSNSTFDTMKTVIKDQTPQKKEKKDVKKLNVNPSVFQLDEQSS